MVMFDIKKVQQTENVSMCGVPSVERTGADTPGNTN